MSSVTEIKHITLPRERIEEFKHLPLEKDLTDQLVYLTIACDTGPLKKIVSLDHEKIFKKSDEIQTQTLRWLRVGLVATSTTVFLLPFLSTWIQTSLNVSQVATYIFAGNILAGTLGACINCISFKATGFLPHASSQADDQKLEAIGTYKKYLKDLSHHLLNLYFSKERALAKTLANDLDVQYLKRQFNEESKTKSDVLFNTLEEVVHWIKTQIVPHNPKLKQYIQLLEKNYEKKRK